ncbi:MAG: hypothetical protein GXO79_01820 [Chlorobi bacterium]|nr:hypothetical protein [Chlorobiota bacterium]
MKTLIILLFSFCLFGCFSKDFKVIDATSQKWVGGIPGSGKGTNYVIKVISFKNNKYLHINQVWIGDEYYNVKALKNPALINETSFEKNDTLYIKIHKYIRTNMLGEVVKPKATEESKVPIKYDGAALIGYTYRGKKKYKEIKTFKELKFIPYQ